MMIWLVVEIVLLEIMEAMSKPYRVEAILLCREDSKWLGYEGIHYPQASSHTGMHCLGIIFLVEFCCDPLTKHSRILPDTFTRTSDQHPNHQTGARDFKSAFWRLFDA